MIFSRKLFPGLVIAGVMVFIGSKARAAEKDVKGMEFFEAKIRPVLVTQCFECHSSKAPKIKGGLLLDTREGARKGGETGPAVVPGNVEKSLILQALRHQDIKMPPKGKLADQVLADFEQWVKMGAPDPRDKADQSGYKKLSLEEAKNFWAFQAPKKSTPPMVRNTTWARSDIDRFILAKLEEKKLRPVADADRRALVRRLYFDLTGLPPTPEDVEAFVQDKSAQALEKVIDRLLASPQYGERWGRHWLDVARYAESNGNADNILFPYAYRYRDYVIAAFNKDKPFDRFVTEQIAGDLLSANTPQEKDENLTATGFLALTSKPRAQNNPDYKMDLIADQIDVTSKAILGLTVMCARCHDHKFDPISTKEYYSLAGIFDSTVMLGGAGGKGAKKGGGGGLVSLSDGYAMGVSEGKPVDCNICIRGESQRLGEKAPRGFLTVATVGTPPAINKSKSGRLELAQWLTQPSNPLTARVMVNRIWMHLFGEGLVRTVDNFGSLGEMPSHQELLDYLAVRFVEDGWSVKKMIKTLVLTRSYQLSTAHDAANYKVDPDNTWVWRMRSRRLEAEAIRDAILTVSGKIHLPPPTGSLVSGPIPKKGLKKGNTAEADTNQRSVYLPIVRNGLPEFLTVFDIANPSLVMGKREVTTVPTQALYLMNSPFVIAQAKHFAERVLDAKSLDEAGRIDLAYRYALARSPSPAELDRALNFLRQGAAGQTPANAWGTFCQTLLASAEFRYLQ